MTMTAPIWRRASALQGGLQKSNVPPPRRRSLNSIRASSPIKGALIKGNRIKCRELRQAIPQPVRSSSATGDSFRASCPLVEARAFDKTRPMPNILVLDDEPLISMLLSEWLTELGHETCGPFQSVRAALALIARSEIVIDAPVLECRFEWCCLNDKLQEISQYWEKLL
jgi:hypothetical protein